MPPFSIPAFRTAFPEFADTVKYPSETIQFWVNLASAMVLQTIWGTQWITGVSLYVAHEITIQQQSVKAAAFGGVPGVSGGIANSKTVGSGSVSFDTTVTAERDGGYWNTTNYGRQFLRLARIFGAGAIQINGSRPPFTGGCW